MSDVPDANAVTFPRRLKLDGVVHDFFTWFKDPRESGHTRCEEFEWFYKDTFDKTPNASLTNEPTTCLVCLAGQPYRS